MLIKQLQGFEIGGRGWELEQRREQHSYALIIVQLCFGKVVFCPSLRKNLF